MGAIRDGKIKWNHKDGTVYYDVVEATEPLFFMVTNKDVVKATNLKGNGDPNQCVGACAVRRQYSDAFFQRDTAYILQVVRGKTVAARYRITSGLRRAIVNFDDGHEFPTGNYMLKPPSVSQTLENKRLNKKRKPLSRRIVRQHIKFTARGRVMPTS